MFSTFKRYYYHNRHHSRMLRIFKSWHELKLHFEHTDHTLWRDANLIGGTFILSTVVENGLNHLRFKHNPGGVSLHHFKSKTLSGAVNSCLHAVTSQDLVEIFGYEPKNETFLGIHYHVHETWKKLVPFNAVIAVYAYICEKLSWYGLNSSAVIIVIISRAVSFKFKNLYLQGKVVTQASSSQPSHGKLL